MKPNTGADKQQGLGNYLNSYLSRLWTKAWLDAALWRKGSSMGGDWREEVGLVTCKHRLQIEWPRHRFWRWRNSSTFFVEWIPYAKIGVVLGYESSKLWKQQQQKKNHTMPCAQCYCCSERLLFLPLASMSSTNRISILSNRQKMFSYALSHYFNKQGISFNDHLLSFWYVEFSGRLWYYQ